jgi:hypothetical protein
MAKKKRVSGKKERIREVNSKTEKLAKKMLGHFIPYEVGMMRALHRRLAAGSPSRLCRNADIESFHVHARNLMEFFKDDKQCCIDPRTFTTRDYRVQGNFIPKKLEDKISQQIVHLTHERTDVEADKLSDAERDQTLKCIEKQIERFEKELQPNLRPLWQEGLRKMNFDDLASATQAFRYSGATGPAERQNLEIPSNYVAGPTNQIQIVTSEPGAKHQEPEPAPAPATPGRRDHDPERS